MKKLAPIFAFILMSVLLCSCCISHHYAAATCTEPETCTKCGKTEGEALGHTWIDADCVTPKTCSVCGKTEGDALGHTWIDADCVTPKTCSVCGETEGDALGHTASEWIVDDVDYSTAIAEMHTVCTVCDTDLESKSEKLDTFIDNGYFRFSPTEFTDRLRLLGDGFDDLELKFTLHADSDGVAEIEITNYNDYLLGWIWFYDSENNLIAMSDTNAKVYSLRICIPFDDDLGDETIFYLFGCMLDVMSKTVDPAIDENTSYQEALSNNTYALYTDEPLEDLHGIYYSCMLGDDDSSVICDIEIKADDNNDTAQGDTM